MWVWTEDGMLLFGLELESTFHNGNGYGIGRKLVIHYGTNVFFDFMWLSYEKF